MLNIENRYFFSGEHFFTVDGVKYAARLSLPHVYQAMYSPKHVENVLIPLIGTIRHHDYPEIERFPHREIIKPLQDLFGVALVPARLNEMYEVDYKGDYFPTVIDNGTELIFHPSMITNFSRFQQTRLNNLATFLTTVCET